MAVIICDTREQKSGHVDAYFDSVGIEHKRWYLPFGDYMRFDNPTIYVDRKAHLGEVSLNLIQDHGRFRNECLLAQQMGARLVVLIEHGVHIKSIDDVRAWDNPRLKESPKAVTGGRLAAIMETMADKYGVEWAFCSKAQTGKRICEILGVDVPK